MRYTLALSEVADPVLRAAIAVPLNAFNTAQAGPEGDRPLVISLCAGSGAVVGGLWGMTGYEWLFIQLLVVPDALRGRGIGTELLALAETEALARGCHGAWLDTYEFQARPFYEKSGYTCFAELPNHPPGYSRYFMKKHLRPTPT